MRNRGITPQRRADIARAAVVVVVLGVAAACGPIDTPAGDEPIDASGTSGTATATTEPGAVAPPPAVVAVCEPAPFLGQPGAPDPPDGLAEQVSRWAERRPDDVAGVWWDGRAGEIVVVAVDPSAAADELATEVGVDAQVRVEQGSRGASELAALQARVGELAEFGLTPSSGRRVWDATVVLYLEFLDDESIAAVRQVFADDLDAICVTGADPATAPPDGPQPIEGDGWRLLHDELTGEGYAADVAVTRAEYDALWTEYGLSGTPPDVDFDAEVVIRFGAVYSGSCPEIRMDDVVIDRDARTVTAEIVQLGGNRDCTADENWRSYVVAVEREALPGVPFTVSAYPDCPWCRVAVVDDLGGSTPTGLVPAGDLPEVLAAAAVHRVTVDNSFGGGSPFERVQVIERLGVVDANGFLDARPGRELNEDERGAIVAALEPLPVEFVAADVLAQTDALDDAPVGRAVLTLGEPAELDGRMSITSQLWCGGLCGIGGANELVRAADGAWSIGESVGGQWIS